MTAADRRIARKWFILWFFLIFRLVLIVGGTFYLMIKLWGWIF